MTPQVLRRSAAFAALVIALLVVAFGVTRSADGTYTLQAQFDDVRGLIAGGEVRAGAVGVGRVTKVEIDAGDRPLVTMAVDDDFAVHEGATADIRLASNVGAVNRTVELTRGDPTRSRLRDGARLGTRRTDQPVNFDEAVETLDPPTRRRLGRLLSGIDDATRGRGADIDRGLETSGPALLQTAALLSQVHRDGEALRTAVSDGERVVGALATDPQALGSAAVRLAGLLDTTAGRRRELTASVRELAPSLRAGRRALQSVADATPELRALARQTGPLVDELEPAARLAPDVGEAAVPFLRETRRLVAGGPAQLRDIRPIARAGRPVAEKLEPVAREALPLARVLQVYVPETVGAFQNFGATAGAYDATGHVLNVAASLVPVVHDSSLSGGAIGPADCDRDSPTRVKPGLLRKPFLRAPGVNECQPWTDLPPGILGPSGRRR